MFGECLQEKKRRQEEKKRKEKSLDLAGILGA